MTLKDELTQMEIFVAKVEKDESLKMIREMFPPKELAGCVIDKTNRASKRFRAYNILDIAFIGDLCEMPEDEIQKMNKSSEYIPAEIVKQTAAVEKYIICKIIMYFAEEEPTQLMYCGNHFFVLKSLQFLVEVLDNSVIVHKYY